MTEVFASSVALAVAKSIRLVESEGQDVNRKVGSWALQKDNSTVKMRELHGLQILLSRPMNRWHNYVNKGVLAETLDLLIGDNPGLTHRFFKFYRQWLSRGTHYPYTYGSRIHGWNEQVDQWSQCVKLLQQDPTTRHAILLIRRPWDLIESYQPCSVFAHFQLNEDGNLDMSWVIRSQDCDSGGLPRNLFMESHLLEQMSEETGIPIGNLYHYATNIHIYDTQYDKTIDVMKNIKDAPVSVPTRSGLLTVADRSYISELDSSKVQNSYFLSWVRYLLDKEGVLEQDIIPELRWLRAQRTRKDQER